MGNTGRRDADAWPGFKERLRERLIELGYEQKGKKEGEPDAVRFALDHRWLATYLYRWLGGDAITRGNAALLAEQLGVSLPWLLFGDPIAKFPAPTNGTAKPRPRTSAGGAVLPVPARTSRTAASATARVPRRRPVPQVVEKTRKTTGSKHYVNRSPWSRRGDRPLPLAA